MMEVLINLLISGLKVDFSWNEVYLKELMLKFGDVYFQVVEVKVNLVELCSCIEVEIKWVIFGVGVNNMINKGCEV